MTSLARSLLLLALLSACAHNPQPGSAAAPATSDPATAESTAPLPNVALTDQMLYEFLLGDIAAQRGQTTLGAQAYLDLARKTRDPRVARRAAQLAYEARQLDLSLEAFDLWQQLEPDSILAGQMRLSLLLTSGKLAEAKIQLDALLRAEPGSAAHTFLSLYPWLSRHADKAAVVVWLQEGARTYPKVAEAHWALAQAAAAAHQDELAKQSIREAVELKPDWDVATLFEAELYLRSEPPHGLALLADFLRRQPQSQEVRLYYARALLDQKQYPEAHTEFSRLLQAQPQRADLAFAVALVSLQMGEYARAEQELTEALSKGGKEDDAVHYYLAQLNETKQDDAAALKHYQQVGAGEYAFGARLREVALLDKAGKLAEARAALRRAEAKDDQQRAQLVMIEGQLLREGKQYKQSYRVLAQGLKRFPQNTDLLYQTAMAADKLKKNQEFEQLIRKLIKLAPDNAHAYNALGYSLLERNVRINEAMKLVEKAYQLAPDDAAIIDSVGWGHYRLGNLEKSVEFLRRAYASNPDPEIAAHLGEVLWKQGDKPAAQKVWAESAQANPDNETLRSVMRRYK